MRRGTTPDFLLQIEKDLREYTLEVTFSQAGRKTILTGDRLELTYEDEISTIAVYLTQEETLALKPGKASVQVRFIGADGYTDATEIGLVDVMDVLNESVMKYDG